MTDSIEQSSRRRRRATMTIVTVAVAYVALRVALLFNPGHTFDLGLYKQWLIQIERFGLSQVYRTSRMDYPPVYAFVLAGLGWVHRAFGAFGSNQTLLTVLIKLPALVFDLGTGMLLWRWGRIQHKTQVQCATLSALYLLNPAVIFDSGYWGQPDSIHTFFIFAGVSTIALGKQFCFATPRAATKHDHRMGVWIGWSCLTLALLMKPLAAPFIPFALVLTLVLYELADVFLGIVAAAVTGVFIFAPFYFGGEGSAVLKRVVADVGAMPVTTANAHNFWWLLAPWRDSEQPWLGPLTPTHVAIILFGLISAAIIAKTFWLDRRGRHLSAPDTVALSGLIGFSFFMLSTHLHENHLFMVLPLFAAMFFERRAWKIFFVCLSIAVLANLYLHDPAMDHPKWPFTIGGTIPVEHPPYYNRNYFATEFVVTWGSAVFNSVLYLVALGGILAGGRFGWLTRQTATSVHRQITGEAAPT